MWFAKLSEKSYRPIPDDCESDTASELAFAVRASARPASIRLSVLAPLLLLSLPLAFIAGQKSSKTVESLPSWSTSMPRVPLDYIPQVWEYSPTYGAEPLGNNHTEPEWEALIPKGQGFVRESPDDQFPKAVAVVHQIHCLYTLRRSYYFLRDPETPIAGINKEHLEPHHIRHCWDLLRQALMCSADSTLESWNEHAGGVTGWGTQRVCRDYNQLKQWIEARRINDRTGFLEVNSAANQHEHHQEHEEIEGNFKPSDASFKPSDASFKPSDASFKPSDASFKPSDASFKPSEASFKPSDASFKPSDASFKPSDASFKPSDASFKPSEASFRPSDEEGTQDLDASFKASDASE